MIRNRPPTRARHDEQDAGRGRVADARHRRHRDPIVDVRQRHPEADVKIDGGAAVPVDGIDRRRPTAGRPSTRPNAEIWPARRTPVCPGVTCIDRRRPVSDRHARAARARTRRPRARRRSTACRAAGRPGDRRAPPDASCRRRVNSTSPENPSHGTHAGTTRRRQMRPRSDAAACDGAVDGTCLRSASSAGRHQRDRRAGIPRGQHRLAHLQRGAHTRRGLFARCTPSAADSAAKRVCSTSLRRARRASCSRRC